LIGTVILRAAVSLANKTTGAKRESAYTGDDDDWSDYPVRGARTEATALIPVPSVGRGMWIMLVIFIVNVIVSFAFQLVFGAGPFAAWFAPRRGDFDDDSWISNLIQLPASFLLMSLMLSAMLPTRFGRGCLVAFFYFLICVGILFVVAAPLLALGLFARL
jgi:hypothetical protein